MKSFYKIITLALLMLGLFSVSGNVWAVDPQVEILYEKKAELVATVNISEAKIVSQNQNNFNISFNISNGEIAQSGVKYGIQLIKNSDNRQYIVDEKVYEETLDMAINTSVSKNINYVAPANIDGTYSLYLKSKNDKGMTFSTALVGEVELKSGKNGLNILNETCYLKVVEEEKDVKYTPRQGVDILDNENIKLFCTAENKSDSPMSVTPSFETFYRSLYGNKAEQTGGDTGIISFNAGENKEISIILPKATVPQAYDVRMNLKNDQIQSNSIIVHYVLRGPSATIQNLSLDKDYYEKGDDIDISFLWSPSADSFPGTRYNNENKVVTYAEIDVVNKNGRSCIEKPLFKELSLDFTNPKILYSLVSKIDCVDPEVIVSLVDSDGKILDKKSFNFETTTSVPFKINTKTIAIVIVLAFVFLFILLRKRKNENNSNYVNYIIIGLVIFSSIFTFAKDVDASTYVMGAKGGAFYANVDISFNNAYSAYKSDETRGVTGSMEIISCNNPITANLYSGAYYLIKNVKSETGFDEPISGSTVLPATGEVAGEYTELFYGDATNEAIMDPSNRTISGTFEVPYSIIGPAKCNPTVINGCLEGVYYGDGSSDDFNYYWTCFAIDGQGEYYDDQKCSLSKPLSCNYYKETDTYENGVGESYYRDYLTSKRCLGGTSDTPTTTKDELNNEIVNYNCSNEGDSVSCSVGYINNDTCYQGIVDENFYNNYINNYSTIQSSAEKLCRKGDVNNTGWDEETGQLYWTCTTGSLNTYPFLRYCYVDTDFGSGGGDEDPEEPPIIPSLPAPVCDTKNIGECLVGKPINLDLNNSTSYTWQCVQPDNQSVPCSIPKTKFTGALIVNPNPCEVPYWADITTDGCTTKLSWFFSGTGVSNTLGKVYVLDEGTNVVSRLDNASDFPYKISKNPTNLRLGTTYNGGNFLYQLSTWIIDPITKKWQPLTLYIYDEDTIGIVQKVNQPPVPQVSGDKMLKKRTSGNWTISAKDEDNPHPASRKEVTYQIDWDMDGKPDLHVPPLDVNGHLTYKLLDDVISFTNNISLPPFSTNPNLWAVAGLVKFQYRATDYDYQAKLENEGWSNWYQYELELTDEDMPDGTIEADGCEIKEENGSSCTEYYKWWVTNPVPEKWSGFNKGSLKLYEGSNTSGDGNFNLSLSEGLVTLHLYHNNEYEDGLHVTKDVKAFCGKTASGEQLTSDGTKCVKNDTLYPNIETRNLSFRGTVTVGVSTPISADIYNIGGIDIEDPIDNKFYFCKVGNVNCDKNNPDKSISYEITGGLKAGENNYKTINGIVQFDITQIGDWFVFACADSDNDVDEGPDINGIDPEKNNCTPKMYFEVIPGTPTIACPTNVKFNDPKPSIISEGGSSTLSWYSTDTAESLSGVTCTITGGGISQSLNSTSIKNGELVVKPSTTTKYTITCNKEECGAISVTSKSIYVIKEIEN